MNPLLIIANPRQIPECIEAFRALDVRRAWLSNYTEWELVAVMDSIMRDESIHFSHAILCADDCVVSQGRSTRCSPAPRPSTPKSTTRR